MTFFSFLDGLVGFTLIYLPSRLARLLPNEWITPMKFRLYGDSPQAKSISILVKDTNRRIMIVQLHYRSHIGFVKHRYLLTLFWQSPLGLYTGTTFCKPKLKEWARVDFNRKVEYSSPSRLLVTPIIPRQPLRELIVREKRLDSCSSSKPILQL